MFKVSMLIIVFISCFMSCKCDLGKYNEGNINNVLRQSRQSESRPLGPYDCRRNSLCVDCRQRQRFCQTCIYDMHEVVNTLLEYSKKTEIPTKLLAPDANTTTQTETTTPTIICKEHLFLRANCERSHEFKADTNKCVPINKGNINNTLQPSCQSECRPLGPYDCRRNSLCVDCRHRQRFCQTRIYDMHEVVNTLLEYSKKREAPRKLLAPGGTTSSIYSTMPSDNTFTSTLSSSIDQVEPPLEDKSVIEDSIPVSSIDEENQKATEKVNDGDIHYSTTTQSSTTSSIYSTMPYDNTFTSTLSSSIDKVEPPLEDKNVIEDSTPVSSFNEENQKATGKVNDGDIHYSTTTQSSTTSSIYSTMPYDNTFTSTLSSSIDKVEPPLEDKSVIEDSTPVSSINEENQKATGKANDGDIHYSTTQSSTSWIPSSTGDPKFDEKGNAMGKKAGDGDKDLTFTAENDYDTTPTSTIFTIETNSDTNPEGDESQSKKYTDSTSYPANTSNSFNNIADISPEISCEDCIITINFKENKTFFGRIYVDGCYEDSYAVGDGNESYGLEVSEDCLLKHITKKKENVGSMVIILEHLRKTNRSVDKLYNVTCFECEKRFTNATSNDDKPKSKLRILREGLQLVSMVVGDPVIIRFEDPDGDKEGKNVCATNELATDPSTGESILLINDIGCPVCFVNSTKYNKKATSSFLQLEYEGVKLSEANLLIFDPKTGKCNYGEQKMSCSINERRRRSYPANASIIFEIVSPHNVSQALDITKPDQNSTQLRYANKVIKILNARGEMLQTSKVGQLRDDSLDRDSETMRSALILVWILAIALGILVMGTCIYSWITRRNVMCMGIPHRPSSHFDKSNAGVPEIWNITLRDFLEPTIDQPRIWDKIVSSWNTENSETVV